jgi:hypothetical protein
VWSMFVVVVLNVVLLFFDNEFGISTVWCNGVYITFVGSMLCVVVVV